MLRADDSSCSFCDIELNLYLTCSSNWGRELLLQVRSRGLVFYFLRKSNGIKQYRGLREFDDKQACYW